VDLSQICCAALFGAIFRSSLAPPSVSFALTICETACFAIDGPLIFAPFPILFLHVTPSRQAPAGSDMMHIIAAAVSVAECERVVASGERWWRFMFLNTATARFPR
jgi:hypothetical protein